MIPWLLLNGKKYSFDQLIASRANESASEFEKSTLTFCKSWITGQQEFFIYTSGSTGPPRQILLKRSQMEASARKTIEALELKAGETSLICLDTKFIAGQMMLVRSLIAGMNIVSVEPSSNPFDKIESQQIDFVALVPYQLENILEHTPEKLNQVCCTIIGGATISDSLKDKIKNSRCAIYATYGMTETLSHIALQRLNGSHALNYFEAFPTINLRLDNRGCLCIKANYLEDEIITNDLVELVAENKFRWLGRIDNIINSGGVKVIPEKVEMVFEKILDSFQIRNRFFITGVPDKKLGSKVVMIFEGFLFNKEIQEKILFAASQQLGKYE